MKPFSLTVLMYHYVRDPSDGCERGSGIPGLPVSRFAAQLDEAMRRFELLAWPEVRENLLAGRDFPARACLLTFDDGLCDHYQHVFPALRARGLSGLFFALARRPGRGLALGHRLHLLLARLGSLGLRQAVWQRLAPDEQQAYQKAEERYRPGVEAKYDEGTDTELLKLVMQRDLSAKVDTHLSRLIVEHVGAEADLADEFYLSPAQMAEMVAGGMDFGGHSLTHPWLDWMSANNQAQEIAGSAAWLSEFQPGPWAFAYPYGGYGAETPALLREHGFVAAFTTADRTLHEEPMRIGRLDGEAV